MKTSILPNPNSIYWDIDWCPKAVFINTPSVYKQTSPNPFPNFPISQKTPAQMGEHDLGNWGMGNGLRYRFPNFPISQKTPAHLAQHYLGNWEMVHMYILPISQFPISTSPDGPSTIWEIGKLGNGWRYRFPNFPISRKISAHLAQHDLGNWEMVPGTYFPISQRTPAQMAQPNLGNWEIGKWLEVQISQFPNFPKDLSPSDSARFGKLGNL